MSLECPLYAGLVLSGTDAMGTQAELFSVRQDVSTSPRLTFGNKNSWLTILYCGRGFCSLAATLAPLHMLVPGAPSFDKQEYPQTFSNWSLEWGEGRCTYDHSPLRTAACSDGGHDYQTC